MKGPAWRAVPQGVRLAVRLTPGSASDRIDGLTISAGRQYVRARVRAAPERGRANEALAELVAAALGVPPSTVTVVSGHSARLKQLQISGDAGRLEGLLAAWIERIS